MQNELFVPANKTQDILEAVVRFLRKNKIGYGTVRVFRQSPQDLPDSRTNHFIVVEGLQTNAKKWDQLKDFTGQLNSELVAHSEITGKDLS